MGLIIATLLLVGVIALAVFLVVVRYDPTWDAEQWGPVAAWFSGAVTVLAVGVALYQTIRSQRQAARAIEHSDVQHKDALAAAKSQYELQLGNERSREQLAAISQICRDLTTIYNATRSHMVTSYYNAERAKMRSLTSEELEQFDLARTSWMKTLTERALAVRLAPAQVYADTLLERLEHASSVVDELLKSVDTSGGKVIDYDAVYEILQRILGNATVLSTLVLLQQPDYGNYLWKKAKTVTEEPGQKP
ncbi:hypothetical protein [Rhodococcoides fascians]|uniref:hypothetical protein n=1 Tax=Rhodococcoides fascians TaxID=1828 RepID=UPI0012D3604B|nr:hypothetical protein [Rhodococcus fascians]